MAKNNTEIVKNLELIATGDTVAQNALGASKAFTVKGVSSKRGTITQVTMISSEGSVWTPALILHIFRADPSISAGDTNISTAQAANYIGVIRFAQGDWEKTGISSTAVGTIPADFKYDTNVDRNVWIAAQNLGGDTFSGEQLEITFYYEGAL